MKGTEWMLIVMTFIVGLVAGGYFYVTAYKPNIEAQKRTLNELDWEIIAREVGACSAGAGCEEFYLASDRSYKYSPDGGAIEEGNVSRAVRSAVTDALRSYRPIEDGQSDSDCREVTGAVNYVYDIEAYGERYSETTCSPQFASSPLADTLKAAQQQIAAGDVSSSTPVLLERGMQGWLEDYLDKKFQYDD